MRKVFFVGHGYGSHNGKNCGLDEQLYQTLNDVSQGGTVIFLGDFIRNFNEGDYDCFQEQVCQLNLNYFLVAGNHEHYPEARGVIFNQTSEFYYKLNIANTTFYILDSAHNNRNITKKQLAFLENNPCHTNNCIVLFHEALWNAAPKFYASLSNSRSRHKKMKELSNFYTEVLPITSNWKGEKIFISGDFGGNPDANSLESYYDTENYLIGVGLSESTLNDGQILQLEISNDSLSFKSININNSEIAPVNFNSFPPNGFLTWGVLLMLILSVGIINLILKKNRKT
jgi:calcineurin-like phosphoesterase family protein